MVKTIKYMFMSPLFLVSMLPVLIADVLLTPSIFIIESLEYFAEAFLSSPIFLKEFFLTASIAAVFPAILACVVVSFVSYLPRTHLFLRFHHHPFLPSVSYMCLFHVFPCFSFFCNCNCFSWMFLSFTSLTILCAFHNALYCLHINTMNT